MALYASFRSFRNHMPSRGSPRVSGYQHLWSMYPHLVHRVWAQRVFQEWAITATKQAKDWIILIANESWWQHSKTEPNANGSIFRRCVHESLTCSITSNRIRVSYIKPDSYICHWRGLPWLDRIPSTILVGVRELFNPGEVSKQHPGGFIPEQSQFSVFLAPSFRAKLKALCDKD